VSVDKDAGYDGDDLPSCGDEGEDVLLKISDDIVDAYLADNLQYANDEDIEQCRRILHHELESREDGPINYEREQEDDDKAIEIGRGEQMIGCWLK
jgi:hypothetical protein